jgi:hypothetical protein
MKYDEFVDLIRNHHYNNFSGLITGVSKSGHSFQIGFMNGDVALLKCRIFRGKQALEKIALLKEVRITQHHTPDITNITIPQVDLPDIKTILARLTTSLVDNRRTEITAGDDPEPYAIDINTSDDSPAIRVELPTDSAKLESIKVAAIHHFGPIGAMVCEDYLSDSNLSSTKLSVLLQRITEDVGANDKDTQAFLESVS